MEHPKSIAKPTLMKIQTNATVYQGAMTEKRFIFELMQQFTSLDTTIFTIVKSIFCKTG